MSAPADGRGGPAVDALVAAGMRFGSLLHVAHPSLVARYRRAMVSMGLPPTTLEDFYIDACGFSPEVAHDIGDDDYLDPYGVNRRLIILTPEQRKLPFLNSVLSADIELIRQFYAANERAIRVLTLKDAVYGEVEDLIFRAASLSDLMGVRTVRFILHTTAGVLEAATEAKGLAERFLAEPDAWKDDTLQDAIIEAAKQCGDVRTNGIIRPTSRSPGLRCSGHRCSVEYTSSATKPPPWWSGPKRAGLISTGQARVSFRSRTSERSSKSCAPKATSSLSTKLGCARRASSRSANTSWP